VAYYIFSLTPVEPKPLLLRVVPLRAEHSTISGYAIFSQINCAILSPLFTLNVFLPKLNKITQTFPLKSRSITPALL
jgi:hypothetical protein